MKTLQELINIARCVELDYHGEKSIVDGRPVHDFGHMNLEVDISINDLDENDLVWVGEGKLMVLDRIEKVWSRQRNKFGVFEENEFLRYEFKPFIGEPPCRS